MSAVERTLISKALFDDPVSGSPSVKVSAEFTWITVSEALNNFKVAFTLEPKVTPHALNT
jgi:hypothetical protein